MHTVPLLVSLALPAGAQQIVGSSVLQFTDQVPSNVLFISIDTFRKDHFGPHGDLGLTPFLSELAAQSVVMEDHVQCSNWTYASTTCTLAGRTNVDRGHIPVLSPNATPIPNGTPFLATWLADAGFYNIIITSNSWLSQAWGTTQGYHEEDFAIHAETVGALGLNLLSNAIQRGDVPNGWFLHLHLIEPHAEYAPERKFRQGLDALNPWMADLMNGNEHYFWRDYYDTLPPKKQLLLEAHLRLLYAGEVRMTDHRIRNVWDSLDGAGMLDDTLVVFWNDHGEQFWEHGNQTHAFRLYGEENDGFLMFWARNILPGTWTWPTDTIDLAPTILDLHGLPRPPEVTGRPIGTAPADRTRFTEVSARSGVNQAVIKDGFKLIFDWTFPGTVELYDRNVDPVEANDLYDPAAVDPKALELWNLLRPQVEAMDAIIPETPVYPPELP